MKTILITSVTVFDVMQRSIYDLMEFEGWTMRRIMNHLEKHEYCRPRYMLSISYREREIK